MESASNVSPSRACRSKWPDTVEGPVGEASSHAFTGSKGEVERCGAAKRDSSEGPESRSAFMKATRKELLSRLWSLLETIVSTRPRRSRRQGFGDAHCGIPDSHQLRTPAKFRSSKAIQMQRSRWLRPCLVLPAPRIRNPTMSVSETLPARTTRPSRDDSL